MSDPKTPSTKSHAWKMESANVYRSLRSGDTGQEVGCSWKLVETITDIAKGPGQSTEDVKWLDQKLKGLFEKGGH